MWKMEMVGTCLKAEPLRHLERGRSEEKSAQAVEIASMNRSNTREGDHLGC